MIVKPYLQMGIGKLRFYLNHAQIPTRPDDMALIRLKNRHRGRRCFVIGTGPSLRMADLERLAERGELCLASNNIFRAFDATRWRPTYYAVEDNDLATKSREQINQLVHCPTFIPKNLLPILGRTRNRTCFRFLKRVAPPGHPRFSRNLLRGINCGGTVTYTLLQVAAWMGAAEAYLLGVDFSYDLGELTLTGENRKFHTYVYATRTRRNHFVADYFKDGQTIPAPDLECSLLAYQTAQVQCHETGRMKIFNATRGGRLEVFQRVDFDSLI